MKNLLFKIIMAILIVGSLWLINILSVNKPASTDQNQSQPISATETLYDFGKISMQDGKVKHQYIIKNSAAEPITITKVHTSCMCTTAIIKVDDKQVGPFGMEGHGGTVPKIDFTIAPGKEGYVEAEFDPAAHGSAGIGNIERSVIIESHGHAKLELKFKAEVRP